MVAAAGAASSRSRRAAARAAVKKIRNVGANNTTSATHGFDGTNAKHIRNIIDDIETEISSRIEKIQHDSETMKNRLEQEKAIRLVKLSKSTRGMTITEFNEKYSVDILSLLLNLSGQRSGSPNHQDKRVKLDESIMETPSSSCRLVSSTPKTVVRDGSGKSNVGSLKATLSSQRSTSENKVCADIGICVGAGKYVPMIPEAIQNFDENMKLVALKQLKLLKDSITSIEECVKESCLQSQ